MTSFREDYPFWTLLALLTAAFLMGGSARDDVLSLIVLRPLGVIALMIGLYGLTREEFRAHRGLLLFAGAIVALVLVHLIPLPPSIWTAIPGRDLAREVGEVAGIAQPWRPLSLVPWRGWNTLFALAVPLAALILAIRCTPRQREHLVKAILILTLASMVWAIAQIGSGYSRTLALYRITNESATGLFANRNHFAALICCAAPMLAFLAKHDDDDRRASQLRWWLIAAAGCGSLLLLLVIGSRSGVILAFVALALAALIIARGQAKSVARGRLLAAAGVGVAIALVIGLAVYFARAEAIERLFARENGEENRFATWGPIAQMIWAYLPFGSGIGSFVDVYRVDEPHALLRFTYLNHAHNDWLEWLLETGLPGLILMLAALLAWGRQAARLLATGADAPGVRLALIGASVLLLLALASVTDYPTRVPSIACVAAIAAVWMNGARAAMRGAPTASEAANGPRPTGAPALARGALIGVAAIAAGYFAFADALTNIAHRRNPALALRFSPNDPIALAVSANNRFAERRGRPDAEMIGLARHSVAALAINPAALQVLGLAATAQGGVAAGRPAMLIANRLTRRDPATQLWLIEEAVGRNAIDDALHHYDVALRTTEEAQPLLFPVLTGALDSEYMWPHFIPYIRQPGPWLAAFTQYAVRNARRPAAFGRLIVQAGGLPEEAAYRGQETELLVRIADSGALAEAARFHRSLRGADPSVVTRMGFDEATTDMRFAPLTWQFYGNPSASASFVAAESGNALELQASLEAGPAILLARKAALLPAGRYRLTATQRLLRAAEGASLTWTLRCGTATGNVLWTASSALSENPARARAEMSIPANCPAVTLQLLGTPGPTGAEIVVSAVSLDRVG